MTDVVGGHGSLPPQDETLVNASTKMEIKQLNFITGNKDKLTVMKAILGDTVNLQSQSLDLVEIQGTIEQISVDKCRRAADAVKGPVLIEDTSLCFNALNELPGPYIKWFFEKLGCEGLNKLLAAYPDKTAQAVCTFAYCEGPGHEPILFQGRTNGKIVPVRGLAGFGWDPIFEYNGQTYAEMDVTEKNKISHSFQALDKLKKWLEES
ncbi:Inosine triphosphate pyrophosphatase [Cladobotryum mycophilum]|uniref:Inosine triphosphate pyrophosphatase n=1 Tax=Cladobotryum mycophilum TaxID=491253 RepID=A0ABR0SC11_9HYPO